MRSKSVDYSKLLKVEDDDDPPHPATTDRRRAQLHCSLTPEGLREELREYDDGIAAWRKGKLATGDGDMR